MTQKKMRYNKEYQKYIASPAWKAFRQQVLVARKNTCEGCGAKTRLHVHHWTYDRLGSERHEDVAVVCRVCHEGLHNTFETAYKDVRSLVVARVNRLREARKQEVQVVERENRNALIKARVAAWMEKDKEKDAPKIIVGAKRRPKAADGLVVEVQ